MLLYRAQSVPSGLRIRTPLPNDPAFRSIGRWFTDDLEAAYRHLDRIDGPSQIVCVEIADAVAETFRVSNTPVTSCGLQPIYHSKAPESDFVIPRFFAVQAEEIETVAADQPARIVSIDFTPRRTEIGRIVSDSGDTVLYLEPTGMRRLTAVCEQTGGSVSFDDDGAAEMGAMLSLASSSTKRQVA